MFPKLTLGYSVSTACQAICRRSDRAAGSVRRHRLRRVQVVRKPCVEAAKFVKSKDNDRFLDQSSLCSDLNPIAGEESRCEEKRTVLPLHSLLLTPHWYTNKE